MHHVIFTDTTHSFVFAHFWTTGISRVWVPAVFPLYTTPMGFISNYKYVTEVRLSALFHFKGLIKVLHGPFSNYKGFKFIGQLTECQIWGLL